MQDPRLSDALDASSSRRLPFSLIIVAYGATQKGQSVGCARLCWWLRQHVRCHHQYRHQSGWHRSLCSLSVSSN